MENLFGADFANVRIHDDAPAQRAASSIQAKAFTQGSSIYFGGSFDSQSRGGRSLLAHELTHVLQHQQGHSGIHARGQIAGHDALERQAIANERAVFSGLGGGTINRATSFAGAIQRKASALGPIQRQGTDGFIRRMGGVGTRLATADPGSTFSGGTAGPGRIHIGRLSVQWNGAASTKKTLKMWAVQGSKASPGAVPPGFQRHLEQSQGSGLPSGLKSRVESLFGLNFGDVRLHTDASAQLASNLVNAEAFTLGEDIFFNTNRFSPHSRGGQSLIVHELTHIAQGRGGSPTFHPSFGGQISGDSRAMRASKGLFVAGQDRFEQQAEINERAVRQGLLGGAMFPGSTGSSLNSHSDSIQRRALGGIMRSPTHGGSIAAGPMYWDRLGAHLKQGPVRRKGGPIRRSYHGMDGGGSDGGGGAVEPGTIFIQNLIFQFNTPGAVLDLDDPALLKPRSIRAAGGGDVSVPPRGFEAEVDQSSGFPIPASLLDQLETLFGVDLDDVRLHTDLAAQAASDMVAAEAFTLGTDIFFSAGAFAPNSARGLALLGHELTHVAQNLGGAPTLDPNWGAFAPGDTTAHANMGMFVAQHDGLERQAELNEAALLRSFSGAGSILQSPAYPGTLGVSSEAHFDTILSKPILCKEKGWLETAFDYWSGWATDGASEGGVQGNAKLVVGSVFAGMVRPIDSLQQTSEMTQPMRDENARYWADVATRQSGKNTAAGDTAAFLASLFAGMNKPADAMADFARITDPARTENAAFWDKLLREKLDQGGFSGNTQAFIYWLLARVNKPLSPYESFSQQAGPLSEALKMAMRRYAQNHPNKQVSFDDPQRKSLEELYKFYLNSGEAAFNRAQASGSFMGGVAAETALKTWLKDQIRAGKPVTLEELVFQAIVFNDGNVTLAMGSIAKVFHDERSWAAHVTGMRNNTKDYYQFAGAYVGLQQTNTAQVLGYGASTGNILGNPIIYTLAGTYKWWEGLAEGDRKKMDKGLRTQHSRWDLPLNYAKLSEFNTGFIAAHRLMGGLENVQRKASWGDPYQHALQEMYGRSQDPGLNLETLQELEKPGLPLEWSVRDRLERILGADMSDVRLHTGLKAEKLAHAIDAEAFTLGQRIVMGAGSFTPDTIEGMGTLVHEATHALQDQRGDLNTLPGEARTYALETEAYAHERAFVSEARSGQVALPAPPPTPLPEPVYREAPAGSVAEPVQVRPKQAVPTALSKALAKAVDERPENAKADAIQRIMNVWNVALPREEFIEELHDRILDIMQDEIELDSQRRETLAWNMFRPMS